MEQHIAAVLEYPLRMPLYGHHRKRAVNQSFDDIVPGAADGDQIIPQTGDCLVVGGIDQRAAAVELIEEIPAGQGAVVDVVALVFSNPFVAVRGGDILRNSAAETDVDKLHSLADAKHRLFHGKEKIQRLKLQKIQFRIYILGTVIGLAEESGRNVPAARQKQMGSAGGLPGVQGGEAGKSEHAGGFLIIDSVPGAADDGKR